MKGDKNEIKENASYKEEKEHSKKEQNSQVYPRSRVMSNVMINFFLNVPIIIVKA